jgi:photosystem II stability/assembly factor-like uncharacterized protein
MDFKKLCIVFYLLMYSNFIPAQWETVYSMSIPGLPNLNCVEFRDFNTGFAAGQFFSPNSCILRTINNGTNWDTVFNPGQDSATFWDITFADTNKIIAVGGKYHLGPDFGIIAKSEDLGNTWTTTITPGGLLSVCFPSPDIGYIGSKQGLVYKTVTGGNTWFSLSTGLTYPITSVHFINDSIGFTCAYENILKTTNGGASWTIQYSGPGSLFKKFSFISDSVGYCISVFQNNGVCKTTDQGNTWTLLPGIIPNLNLQSFFFTGNDTGYFAGLHMVTKTTDEGNSWQYQTASSFFDPDGIMDIYFLNPDTGFIIGWEQFYRIKTATGRSSIPVMEDVNHISVYPNPGSDWLSINILSPGILNLEARVYSLTGQLVLEKKLVYDPQSCGLDISSLRAGMYIIRLQTGPEDFFERKFIVYR